MKAGIQKKTMHFGQDARKELEERIENEIAKREANDKKEGANKTFENWLTENQIKKDDYISILGGDEIIIVEDVNFDNKVILYKSLLTEKLCTANFSDFDFMLKDKSIDGPPKISSETEAKQKIEEAIKFHERKISQMKRDIEIIEDAVRGFKNRLSTEFSGENK